TPAVVDPDSPEWAPRCEERYLPASTSVCVEHRTDRSSACAPAWLGSPPDRLSTIQSGARPTCARTSASVRWPRFPPAPVSLLPGYRTPQPQRDALAAVLRILLFPCPPRRSAACSGDNRTL